MQPLTLMVHPVLETIRLAHVLKEWPAWSYMFVTWFSSQFTHDEDALDWTKSYGVEVVPKSEPDRRAVSGHV